MHLVEITLYPSENVKDPEKNENSIICTLLLLIIHIVFSFTGYYNVIAYAIGDAKVRVSSEIEQNEYKLNERKSIFFFNVLYIYDIYL